MSLLGIQFCPFERPRLVCIKMSKKTKQPKTKLDLCYFVELCTYVPYNPQCFYQWHYIPWACVAELWLFVRSCHNLTFVQF